MKTSIYTHSTRTAIRAGKPTGYTQAAEIVAASTGRMSVSGNVPIHWLRPGPDARSLAQRAEDYRRRAEQSEMGSEMD